MKRHTKILLLLTVGVIAAGVSGCSSAGSSSSESSFSAVADGSLSEQAPAADSAGDDSNTAETSVIRTGDISIEVSDPGAATQQVTGIATDLGGSVDSMTTYGSGSEAGWSADLTIRVPEDRFDDAFEDLETVGNVLGQSRSAHDVTLEHVDLQARVEAMEASVQRLQDLMAQSASTADLLEAETVLSERQQELDSLQGQLQALEGQIAYSTITVSLGTDDVLPGGPKNFWEGFVAGFESLGTVGSGALVVLGVLLPWLLLAGAVFALVLVIRRSARKRRSAQTAPSSLPDSEPADPSES